MSQNIAVPEEAQLESLAEQLMSIIARRQNSGQLRGLHGNFTFGISIQDGNLNHFALDSHQTYRPTKKK